MNSLPSQSTTRTTMTAQWELAGARQRFLCEVECAECQSQVRMTPHLSDGGCCVFVHSTHPMLLVLMPNSLLLA